MKKVEIYTDGACSGNPGPGGWGAILRYKTHEKEIFGSENMTTNNRMELTAIIKALEVLKERCVVSIYSDSKYVCDAITNGWAKKWKENGWKRGKSGPAMNSDLWDRLLTLIDMHETQFFWVKGHSGHPENERCDSLAVCAIKALKKNSSCD